MAFIADSLDNAHRFQQVFSQVGVDVSAGSTVQIDKLLAVGSPCDAVVFESRGHARGCLARIKSIAEDRNLPLLLIVDEPDLDAVAPPYLANCDYVVHGASSAECAMRLRRLMWSEGSDSSADLISIDALSINLATYQVTVAGDPVDFTYLEYALLAFLAKHPGRTFSRDALLQAALERWEAFEEQELFGKLETVADPAERLRSLFQMVAREFKSHVVYSALLKAPDHPAVLPVIGRVSQRRLDYLTASFRQAGLGRTEARHRARLTYAAYVGFLQLNLQLHQARMPQEEFDEYVEHLMDTLVPR